MTYGLGLFLREGIVIATDSRTNAGVDHIAVMRKLNLFQKPGSHLLALGSAGNLATSQSVVALLNQRLGRAGQAGDLFEAASLFDAARVVGDTLREVMSREAPHVQAYGDPNASFLLGGEIAGDRHHLFLIYSAGNFIEATEDTPYLQIGELKYGKPILDRIAGFAMPLAEAVKITLLSFDATIRSNLSVAPPLDLFVKRAGSLEPLVMRRVTADDPYLTEIRHGYAEAIRGSVAALPRAAWLEGE